MDNKNTRPLIAHLSMFFACAFWGLMAPLGKDAMTHGITGIDMVTFRVCGAAVLFWLTSFFTKRERVMRRDLMLFPLAGLFGLVCNQCCYTIGLSITSPINASIVTTSMPIFAMILAALILKEPITGKKAAGVLMGCSGALILILTSAAATNAKEGESDAHMGRGSHTPVFIQSCGGHTMGLRARVDMVRDCLCRCHRHLLELYTHYDRTAHPASHGGEYI